MVHRRLTWIESINLLKMWGGFVQTLAVDDQMPVVADSDVLVAQGNHAFDVKLIRRKMSVFIANVLSFKNDDFAARWSPKIVT